MLRFTSSIYLKSSVIKLVVFFPVHSFQVAVAKEFIMHGKGGVALLNACKNCVKTNTLSCCPD